MGSGTNATPIMSGLLRRRYSMPEIIMRKHKLAQQKSYDESPAATAPSQHHASPMQSYSFSSPTSSTRHGVTISTGSDSNLSRKPERGEMSMRKSTLLRRIWSRDLKRYDTRSGSWSPPMRRSQRRLNVEPAESFRCEECRKLDFNNGDEDEELVPKRLRLVSNHRQSLNSTRTSSTITPSTDNHLPSSSERPQVSSSNGAADDVRTPPSNVGRAQQNLHIFMTPMQSDATSSELAGQGQDMLRVEIETIDTRLSGENNGVVGTKLNANNNHVNVKGNNTCKDNFNNNSTQNDELNNNGQSPNRANEDQSESESSVSPSSSTNGMKEPNDSELDLFISNLLIENLKDLEEEISRERESNNNYVSTTTSSQRDTDNNELRNRNNTSSIYLTPEHIQAVVNGHTTSIGTSQSTNSLSDKQKKRIESVEEPEKEKVIYFPSYNLENKEEMSSYTSNNSDFELSQLPQSDVIKVTTGSSYQVLDINDSVVVPRILTKYPRTESLEAQPSSASNVEEENCDGSEESVSLVDSLDDPSCTRNESSNLPAYDTKSEEPDEYNKLREKSEAFFIPISETESELPTTVPVAVAMPEKLKEKISQRQKELDTKREEDMKKKQKNLEKIMDPKLEDENFFENIPSTTKKDSPIKENSRKTESALSSSTALVGTTTTSSSKHAKSHNTTILRNEIGLLESYTIDSKGNMQFRAPPKNEDGKTSKKTRRLVKQQESVQVSSSVGQSNSTNSSLHSSVSQKKPHHGHHQCGKNRKPSVTQDVQKMTIFQTQSDIITPDTENGPRRVYQKTEIQDGEKCIEILEIVECADSSVESSPERRMGKTYRIEVPSSKSAMQRRSKIPIPIYKTGKSAGFQKASRCTIRESSPGQCFSRNFQGSCSTRVDRAIAELLIDALNRPDEVGIEIIKSPKEVKEKSCRRMNISRRNTPRRSASSNKYHQIFEVIPEEKSSFSFDSSNDETSKSSKPTKSKTPSPVISRRSNNHVKKPEKVSSPSSTATSAPKPSFTNSSTNTSSTTTISSQTLPSRNQSSLIQNLATTSSTSKSPIQSSTSSPKYRTKKHGRVGMEPVQPKAWIGFFKHHNGTSLEEDDAQTQTYADSSSEHTIQPTDLSLSTITANAGTNTPQIPSDPGCPASTESTNALTLIDQTFGKQSRAKQNTPLSISKSLPKVLSVDAAGATSPECIHMKFCQKCRGTEPETTDACTITDQLLKIEIQTTTKSEETTTTTTASLSDSTPGRRENTPSPKLIHKHRSKKDSKVDVWRVQSPDICKYAIPKLQKREESHNIVESVIEDSICEIDSRSFVVIPDARSSESYRPKESSHYSAKGTESEKCPRPSPETSTVSEATSSKCSACCFCNPDLHKLVKDSEKYCPYCNRKKTPLKREEETNTETDFFANHRVYQSMTKTDHTHTRTRSRDSDVISTKCTKTNEKIKHYMPEDKHSDVAGEMRDKKKSTPTASTSTKTTGKNLNRPKNVNSLPKCNTGTVNKVVQNNIKGNKESAANCTSDGSKPFRLPSPYTLPSSNSYDGTTSPTSSSDSTCPTTPNKCPQLPPTRRQNQFPGRHINNRRRYPKTHETENYKTPADIANNNSDIGKKTGDQNQGWSVTLAGSYNQDLAPDVEMRLSFPKKIQTEQKALEERQVGSYTMQSNKNYVRSNGSNGYSFGDRNINEEDLINDNYPKTYHPALPPPGGINPKKALTRIVSERTHSQKDINFPEVSTTHNQMVSKQTAKKAIKHVECSVAVTSATRTISNFARGRRTMSYQTLNTESHKITNRDRHVRDNSLELGSLSSRRMTPECHTPSELLALSVMGNAIAPEQKPRVPTMSEKDLTRRHSGCFTRNRFFT